MSLSVNSKQQDYINEYCRYVSFKKNLAKKGFNFEKSKFEKLYSNRKGLITKHESLLSEKNIISKDIGLLKSNNISSYKIDSELLLSDSLNIEISATGCFLSLTINWFASQRSMEFCGAIHLRFQSLFVSLIYGCGFCGSPAIASSIDRLSASSA